jgi:hypothetical protein
MRVISINRKAVSEVLGGEGWRFSLTDSPAELKLHRHACRTVTLPVGNESENRSRTVRERLLRQLPWDMRGQPYPRWLSYISVRARKRLQTHLPLAAEFCLTHGFIFLVGEVWAERQGNRWRIHRGDGPAVVIKDRGLHFWRGLQVSKKAVLGRPTAEAILAETNQTEREVLLERLGVENFVQEAQLQPVDVYGESVLLKVNTAEKQGRWTQNQWVEEPVPLAFVKVVCPSTQKTYFLRVDPLVETVKQALESTLPGHSRDWEKDLVVET